MFNTVETTRGNNGRHVTESMSVLGHVPSASVVSESMSNNIRIGSPAMQPSVVSGPEPLLHPHPLHQSQQQQQQQHQYHQPQPQNRPQHLQQGQKQETHEDLHQHQQRTIIQQLPLSSPSLQWRLDQTQHHPHQVPKAIYQSPQDIAAEERTSKALLRLSEFSRAFDCSLEHQTLQFWRTFVDQFFETNGRLRLKLSNPATLENKVFELRTPSIPVYYLGSVEAGIKNQQLILEQALVQTKPLPLSVECPSVTLASHYTNGAKVFTSGAMKAIFTDDFKFTLLELTSLNFTEYIARPLEGLPVSMLPEPKFEGRKKNDLKRSMTSQHNPSGTPESIVNGFGITLKAMRLLEVSDTCSKMGDLIQWSVRCKASSAEIFAMASQIRDLQSFNRNRQLSIQSNSPTLVNPGDIASQNHPRASASPRSMKQSTKPSMDVDRLGSITTSPRMCETTSSAYPDMGTLAQGYIADGTGHTETSSNQMMMASGPNVMGSSRSASISMTSPVFASSSVNVTPPTKTTKRSRAASETPTLTAANPNPPKRSSISVSNGASSGRSRRGSGRRDSATKRKASVAEASDSEVLTMEAGAGSHEPTALSTPVHVSASNHNLTKDQRSSGMHVYYNEMSSTIGQDGPLYSLAMSHQHAPLLMGQNSLYHGVIDNPAGLETIQELSQGGNNGLVMNMGSNVGQAQVFVSGQGNQGQPQGQHTSQGYGYGTKHGTDGMPTIPG